MSAGKSDKSDDGLRSELQNAISFQRKWQIVSMCAYVVSTAGTVFCTAAAAILAALNINRYAALLAGAATVLVSIEKSLLFREKWRLHLGLALKNKNILLGLEHGQLDVQGALKAYQDANEQYSTELPIAPRE
jgi:hypothetical protein